MSRELSPIHRAPLGGEYYVFRDAVHNLIEIEDAHDGEYIRELLRTPELQRLRLIKQNGLSSLVYPSIETTRFPHALGSFHIAQRITKSLFEHQPPRGEELPEYLRLTRPDCLAFSVAALLHDIGHGPLSHIWEECWAEPLGLKNFHEHMGRKIVSDPSTSIGKLLSESAAHHAISDIGPGILRFLKGEHHLDYLFPLLEGNLDVDRLDFIARDTRAAGVTYGSHDLEWIIRSFRFARLPARYIDKEHPHWVIAIDGRKGLSTLVQFLHARENMYRLVYYHKTTRAATCMLSLLFKRARLLAEKGSLMCDSRALRDAISLKPNEDMSVQQFLRLDDSDIWSSIKAWAAESADSIIKDLSRRLLSRDLFKVFLLSEDVYKRLRDIDKPECGRNLRTLAKTRLDCSADDAEYYYALDETTYDVIGRSQQKLRDVWIMESGSLGFQFQTLRDYWRKEVRSPVSRSQYLLVVHPALVPDLDGIVKRLSFPSDSVEESAPLPEAPPPYRLVAPLSAKGAWKEVYVAANTTPGSAPETIVALKRYKTIEGELTAIQRDVTAINLLAGFHGHLSSPRLLPQKNGETWILEPLWTGSLEDLAWKDGPRRDILEIFEIAEQLFSALAWLHGRNLRHTDIKPDNCGIVAAGSAEKMYVLGDFGCLSSVPDKMPSDPRLLGTLRTRAPEIIENARISLKSDVWAMAATIYSLCLMRYPFVAFDMPHHDQIGRTQREKEIQSNMPTLIAEHRKSVQDLLPPILSDVLEKCFDEEKTRPSAQHTLDLLRTRRAELVRREERLFKTAWQRAEDVVEQSKIKEELFRAGTLAEERRQELRDLVTAYQDFVPPLLKVSLQTLLSQAQPG